jgi:hypothetical protein
MEEEKMDARFWWGNLKEGGNLDMRVEGRILLKCTLKE